jgi:hypothetical protein
MGKVRLIFTDLSPMAKKEINIVDSLDENYDGNLYLQW